MSDHNHQPTDPNDDALQELLGIALRQADPVPRHVVAAARGAFTWPTIDQELADLVFDSAIEVMVADPATRRLVGQLVPARPATVRLEGTESVSEQEADRFGRFTFDGAPPGPLRITVSEPDGAAVSTDWILL